MHLRPYSSWAETFTLVTLLWTGPSLLNVYFRVNYNLGRAARGRKGHLIGLWPPPGAQHGSRPNRAGFRRTIGGGFREPDGRGDGPPDRAPRRPSDRRPVHAGNSPRREPGGARFRRQASRGRMGPAHPPDRRRDKDTGAGARDPPPARKDCGGA